MAACLLCLELLLVSVGPRALAEEKAQNKAEEKTQASVTPSALVQVDGVPFDQTSADELDPGTGAPLNRERFSIPRVWLTLNGQYGYARGLVQLEGSTIGPNLRVLGAELGVTTLRASDAIRAEAALGLFLIPFGIETQEVVPRRMFLEASSWVNALFPGRRDLGARVSGAAFFARYQLAVMNGNPSAAAVFPAADPNRAKDVVGRLAAEGELFPGLVSALGVSGLWGRGFHPGTRPTKNTLVTRDANEDGIVQTSEIQIVTGNPGEPSRNFGHFALGGDVSFTYTVPLLGEGRSYGEVAWAKNLDRALFVADPIAQGRAQRELGLMFAIRQQLTRHAELGVRLDSYLPDLDARERHGVHIETYNAEVRTWAFALAWCSLSRLRITLEYDRQKNPFGRTPGGSPTTLAADVVTLRGQLEI